MYRVEILCDHADDLRARDARKTCYSLSNRHPGGSAVNIDAAAAMARRQAEAAGWKRKATSRARTSIGWTCPNCATRDA